MRRVGVLESTGPEDGCTEERSARVLRLGLDRLRGPPEDCSSFGFAPAPANVRPIFEGR